MAVNYATEIPAGQYGPLQVLKSAAGYYVGTLFADTFNNHDGTVSTFNVPGSRDSGYFATEEEAQRYLDYCKE